MNKQLLSRQLLFCCLFFLGGWLSPSVAGAQSPISISGPSPACLGDVQTYTFSPLTSGLNYAWSVTAQGNVLSSGGNSAQIQWISTGSATITVTGTDTSGMVMAQGTLPVTVNALPNPIITASTIVNCEPLDVTRDGKPHFEDSSGCYKVCAYSPVTYTVPNNPGSTYTWVVNGDVNHSSSGNTCNVNWGAPGIGNVTVTETQGACSGTATMCITIIEGPQARFETMPNQPSPDHIVICRNSTVIFIDQSTSPSGSPIVSWVWDFGDGSYSSAGPGTTNGPIQHQYTDPGDYEATLTVTNSCGCSSTYTIRVTVLEDEGVKIECPRVVCEGERATYFVDVPCDDFNWEVIGGNIAGMGPDRVDVVWDQVGPDGFGYVSYTTACGKCPGTTVIKVPVVLQHGTIQGPTSVCPNQQFLYSLPQWPTTDFTWSVTGNATILPTDQPNQIALTTGASGSFTLSVSYCNTMLKCSGEAQLTGTILPPADINGPDLVCIGGSANYTLTGVSTATWKLQPPTGGPIVYSNVSSINPTFNQLGTYTLSISGAFCPPDPLKIKVRDNPPPPNQIIGPDSVCAGVPVQYTAQNPLAGTLFQWGATPGTVNSVSGNSTYATFSSVPAQINVRRITTDAAHCLSAPLVKTVWPPVPPLTLTTNAPDTFCGSTQWHFDLNYDDGDLYQWSIIDQSMGSVVTGNATAHTQILFNNPIGSGALVKIAVKMRKCLDFYYDTVPVYVMNAPVLTATASPATVCAGDLVTFTVLGVPTLNTATGSVNWDFGDGNGITTGINPVNYAYTSTGAVAVYHPSVTVVNPNGCISTATVTTNTVSVKPTPVAHVSPDGLVGCGAFSQPLTATVTTGFGSTTNYQWFGPTTSPPAPNCSSCTSWTVNTYGAYYVKVTNSNTCSAISNIVNIQQICPGQGCTGPAPTLVSDGTGISGCATITGTVTYSANGTTILNQYWSAPSTAYNVTSSTGFTANIEASFPAAGYYTFIYQVQYNNGSGPCWANFPVSQKVPFVGDMLYDVACGTGSNYSVTLYDHSNIYPGETINHIYQYRLGTSGTWITIPVSSAALSATVSLAPGTYQIRERITSSTTPSASQCITMHTIVLPAKPVANFNIVSDYMPACEKDVTIHFTNTSTPSPLSYVWTFGDVPNTNYVTSPGRVYDGPSPVSGYNVKLIATNELGCSSTKVKPVIIKANTWWDYFNYASLDIAPLAPCQGSPATLTYIPPTIPSGLFNPPSYTWFEGTSPISPLTSSSTFAVTSPGGYWVTGSDQYGCRVPSDYTAVNFTQVPPAVINGKPEACLNEPFTLNGFAGNVPGITYQWTRSPGGFVGNTPTITQTLGAGTYTYTLTVSVPNGGSGSCDNTSAPFTVTVNNPPPVPSVAYSIVGCNPYEIELTGSNSVSGTYNWSNGTFGTPSYATSGGYYLLTFTDANGCTSQNSLYALKDPAEYLWIFPSGCFCKGMFEGFAGGVAPNAERPCEGGPYITGPIIPFSYWDYLFNGAVDISGSGLVPPYNNFLTLGPGTYNLTLDNGVCSVTSDTMYYGGKYCDKIGQRPAPNGLEDAPDVDGIGLKLIPNPADMQTLARYRFSENGKERYIEVYDMVGRQMQRYKAAGRSGSQVLPLADYAAGMYRVLLREDGKIIAQSKLSVTK